MKGVMMLAKLNADQMELQRRWLKIYTSMKQENQLLAQQVDYLEDKIALLQRKLLEARMKETQ